MHSDSLIDKEMKKIRLFLFSCGLFIMFFTIFIDTCFAEEKIENSFENVANDLKDKILLSTLEYPKTSTIKDIFPLVTIKIEGRLFDFQQIKQDI